MQLVSAVKAGSFTMAVQMALEFFSGHTLHIATGIPSEPNIRRQVLGDYIMDMLKKQVGLSLSVASDHGQHNLSSMEHEPFELNDQDTDQDHVVQHLAKLCIDTSLVISREDELFGEIFELFSAAGMDAVFFEELEPYILGDRFGDGLKDASVAQGLVQFYTERGLYKRLEECLLHLHPSALNVDAIMSICQTHQLYLALIYVYNQGLHDFVSPLIVLLKLMELSNIQEVPAGKQLVNKAPDSCYITYVYLAFIFTGRGFPHNKPLGSGALQAKTDAYNFLFSPQFIVWPPMSSNLVEVTKASKSFPYLSIVVQYDSEQFFLMLATAFEDLSLSGELFVGLDYDTGSSPAFGDKVELNRQFIIDILCSLLAPNLQTVDLQAQQQGQSQPPYPFAEIDVVRLLCFLASSVVKYSTFISLDMKTYRNIIFCLLGSSHDILRTERQFAMELLLEHFGPHNIGISESLIIDYCERAKFYQIAEKYLRKSGQLDKVLSCYLNDENRKAQVFDAISQLAVEATQRKVDIESSVLERIPTLVELSPSKTATIVDTVFGGQHVKVLMRLQGYQSLEYSYLQALLDLYQELGGGSFPVSQHVLSREEPFEQQVYDRYIELLCHYHPESVKPFLTFLDSKYHNCAYDLERAKQLTQQHQLASATAWVLERTGDVFGSLQLLLQALNTQFSKLIELVHNLIANHKGKNMSLKKDSELVNWVEVYGGHLRDATTQEFQEMANHAINTLEDIVVFCQRNSKRLSGPESHMLWVTLLDNIIGIQKSLAQESNHSGTLPEDLQLSNLMRKALQIVLNGMLGFTSLPPVLFKIVNEQAGAQFQEIRDIVFSFLEMYDYEENLVQVTTKLLSSHTDKGFVGLYKLRSKALRPRKGLCRVCQQSVRNITSPVVLQNIGAETVFFHPACIEGTDDKQ
ncbi:Vacuolar protein sorting-associated protein 8 [Gonapodya sp. JEL0774]|nr:Vacuolar protein sorting-associated protein 8 [Gonapodya sp. JEL0774]